MLRTTLTKSYTLCGIGQGSWWRPEEIPSSWYWKKGRMLPIRECRTGLWWEALGSPQGLLKGTQVGIQSQGSIGTWGWVATAQSAHVREPGKKEFTGRGRQNSMYFSLCLNLKHSFKLLNILERYKHLGHCSWEQKDTWGKGLQDKCQE